jgi:hypothetical protein
MRKVPYLIAVAMLTLFNVHQVNAQATYGQDVNGSALKASRYLDINGSPFLFDSWLPAMVQLENGQTYKLDVKYDLVADNLIFKDKNGDSLAFVLPIKEFKFTAGRDDKLTHSFKSGFPQTTGNTGKNTLYEVLFEGTTTLLKKQSKSIWEETTTYGTANRTKNISSKTIYYIVDESGIKPLKNQRKAVTSAFGSKSADVEKYIKENKLDVSKEEDLIKVFAYGNTLK